MKRPQNYLLDEVDFEEIIRLKNHGLNKWKRNFVGIERL